MKMGVLDNMTAYEIMLDTTRHLIRGGGYNESEKSEIVRRLYDNQVTDGKMRKAAHVYPRFFIPPHNNGKALPTIIPMGSKTFQVGDNAYEFEILRLMHLFQPDDEVAHMIDVTKERLKKTCFGYQSCHYVECFEAGMMVLRFLSFAATDDRDWITKQINVYNNHFNDRKHHNGVQKYYWLILSDMPFCIAEPEIERQKEHIIGHLSRSYLMKNGNEDIPLYAMRNALSRLPAYLYLKDRRPYVNKKTGRMEFDMDR
jgi:hypothetical protein